MDFVIRPLEVVGVVKSSYSLTSLSLEDIEIFGDFQNSVLFEKFFFTVSIKMLNFQLK